MDPQRLYREIIDLDKQLRELVRSNPLNTEQANEFRTRLMNQARSLVQLNPLFAATHELEQLLWKPCFYKRIEEFRPRIRKYVTAVHANPQDRSIREHFQRVSNAFQAFIQQAVVFYEELRAAYWKWLENHRVNRIAAANTVMSRPTDAAVQQDTCRTSLHRCFVFLGDLMRYRELHGQKAKKNFTAASQYYHQALAVLPSNGNPHNQLAVLAMYVEAEAVAVYRYCRSLLVSHPFITAEENLALLFERSRQRPVISPEKTLKEDKNIWLKSALHRFTRLHGALFSQIMACRHQDASSNTSTAVYSIEMESLLLQEISRLIEQNVMGDALILKLVITNVFCMLQAQSVHAIQRKVKQLADVEENAIRLSTRLITVVMESILQGLSISSGYKGLMKMMGTLSVYLDILRSHPYLLERMETVASRGEYVDGFLQRLVQLVNHPQVQQVNKQDVVMDRKLLLKEYVELRGFEPLKTMFEASNCSTSWREDVMALTNGNNNSTRISDEEAWQLRATNLIAFATYLCHDYTGNPLLYYDQGQFATTPSVVSRMTAVALEGEVGDELERNGGDESYGGVADVEFDDEVIVYQPDARQSTSPLFASSMLPLSRNSSATSTNASVNHALPSMSPFGTSSTMFGGGAAMYAGAPSTCDIGAGFGSFHDAFSSASGLKTAGWGVSTPSPKTPSSLAPSTSTPLRLQRHLSTGSVSLFDEMEELTAVERESSMYEQKTSSLSGLFGGIGTTSFGGGGTTPIYQTSPPPKPQRAASSGNARPSPPPGFRQQQPPPGFGDPQPPTQPLFFTRNPFVNP